jgi:hypothetical protein
MTDDGFSVNTYYNGDPLTVADVDEIVAMVIENRITAMKWTEVYNRVLQMCAADKHGTSWVCPLWRHIEMTKALALGEDGMRRMKHMFMYYHRCLESEREGMYPLLDWHVIRDHCGEDYYVFYDKPQVRPPSFGTPSLGRFYGGSLVWKDNKHTAAPGYEGWVKLQTIQPGIEGWERTMPWRDAVAQAMLTRDEVNVIQEEVLAHNGKMEKYNNTTRSAYDG